MKDSEDSDSASPVTSPLNRPCRHNLPYHPPSSPGQHRQATAPGRIRPGIGRSWPGKAGLLAVAMVGAVGLVPPG